MIAKRKEESDKELQAFDVHWTEWHYAKIRVGSEQEIRERFWDLVGEQTEEAYGVHEITRIKEVKET